MMTARPLRGVGPFGSVVFALAEHTTPGERARALPPRLACELFDAWCPPHRSIGGANATIIESAVSLGGRLGEDAAALRLRVREALRLGRMLALREERGAVATAAQRQESTEALEPLVEEKLEDIRIVTVEDRTWRRLSGIKLTIAPGNGGPTTKNTDDEGAVVLRGLRPGMCRVSAAFEGATLATCYELVGIDAGEAPTPTDKGDDEENDERRFALVLKRHKVATGETLASVAEAYGMTWQLLAKFNFGSTAPREVNRGLRNQVGCRQKTADRANYVFDSDDAPGILFIPEAWEHSGLQTDRTHTLRFGVPHVERTRRFIFSM